MIRFIHVLCALFLLAMVCGGLHGQVPTGTPPVSSVSGGPDVINLANLNSHITIPVLHKPGRGLNFNYDLSYDTSVWYPVGASGSQTWKSVYNWGWRGSTEVATGYVSNSQTGILCYTTRNGVRQVTGIDTIRSGWVYHDAFGTSHNFNLFMRTVVGTGCGTSSSPQQNATATDGSGLTLSAGPSGYALYTRAGKNLNVTTLENTGYGAGSSSDRNGNQVSVSNSGVFTDTLGSTVLTVSGSGTPSSPTTFTYTAPNNQPAAFTMKFTTYNIRTNFGCSTVGDYGTNGTTTAPLVSEIDLPDGTKYTFTYEPTPGFSSFVTGRLASVTLPTGGTISYAYSGGNNGINCADGSTATLTRTTPDGTWTYAQVKGSGAASTTTITAPKLPYDSAANQTVVQFQGIYETQRKVFQGSASSGTLLRSWNTCYNGAASPCTGTAITLPITQRTVIDQFGSSGLQAKHNYQYNAATGTLAEQDDYDYGSGGPGPLLKKTLTTYAPLTGITSFPKQVTVQNGAGTTISQTVYNYGDTVTSTNGTTPQLTSPSGSRGNLLSVNYYTQGSTFLTKSYTYYDTGNVNVATDVNGAPTTYTYGSGSCGNSFATTIAEPLSLSRTMTYNCTGGILVSGADENGNASSASYTDANFWRPNSSTDQTNAQTTLTYTGQTQVEANLSIVSGSSASDPVTTLDNLGRSSLSQVRQVPGGSTFDSVETDYDVIGRPNRKTLPFAASLGQKSSSAPGSTTAYDALGRVTSITDSGNGTITNSFSQNDVIVTRGPAPTGENAKKHQSEYDSLGRLTSVCEITSAGGSGSCGQTNSATGYWTKYNYDAGGRLAGVTQNAQSSGSTQTRSYSYDLMGRMTSETEAESGTTTLTYDTDTTCGSSSGDLVKRTDAVGNVTCYSYDALHRVLSVTYPSGSYASKTPNKYFVYDTATVNGVAMSNGKTRMVEAYTAASQDGTKITDEGFSYTVRGEPSDIYESTPNSGGYYHVAEQYWANGAAKQLSGLSSLPTFTYTPDGEGRVNQVAASAGQNPLTNTIFNNASLPTSVTFGSGDTDSFSYDPNTSRMTQYQFSVNGQSLTGVLTWNANSTLQNLSITDALNSSDTQNCAFLYDDLARLQSANCGSVWSQTFSYDSFGNIAKSGSATFAASYNTTTNRINSVGGFTPTYDANGNTLTDPAHTYSWDSAGKPVTIDNVNMTYDALGRMVEQNRSGTYTQFVYGPHGGKFAIMSGQTLQKAILPLVGGAQAVYNASGLLYYGHSDHLGSVRLGSTPSRTMSFDLAYAPFGETYASSGSTDPSFTGQRQDTVNGLFDFPAREYSNEGRWSSPDPSGSLAFHLTDPQSINRYAYARNTPLSVIDPTGLNLRNPFSQAGGGSCSPSCQETGGGGGPGNLLDTLITENPVYTDNSGSSSPVTVSSQGDSSQGGGSQGSGDACVTDGSDCGITPTDPCAGGGCITPSNTAGPIPSGLVADPGSASVTTGVSVGGVPTTNVSSVTPQYQLVDQNGNSMPLEGLDLVLPLSNSIAAAGSIVLTTDSKGQITVPFPIFSTLAKDPTFDFTQNFYIPDARGNLSNPPLESVHWTVNTSWWNDTNAPPGFTATGTNSLKQQNFNFALPP